MKPAEAYIFNQSHLYQSIMLHLLQVIQQNVSDTELLFKWGIPYVYYKKKPFCYLAPNHKKGLSYPNNFCTFKPLKQEIWSCLEVKTL